VVSDFLDQSAMYVADLAHVWRVNDHFAAVSDRGLGLVRTLGRGPDRRTSTA
jgi:hypothetical protein